MAFENIIGQARAKLMLSRAVEQQRVSHAYLFVGEKGVGKEAMALALARVLLCARGSACPQTDCPDCRRVAKLSHPDLHFLFPAPSRAKEEDRARIVQSLAENPYARLELWSNPVLSIDRIREIRRSAAYKSFEGQGRVVILTDCERMTAEAANALLKILEEPPERTYLVLISSRPHLLLETITSRCQLVKFEPLSPEAIEGALVARQGAEAAVARVVSRLAGGSYRKALQLLDQDVGRLQDQALEFFRKAVQDAFAQVQFVEELQHRYQRDQQRVKELLEMVLNWLRDAMVFRETGGQAPERLINVGRTDVLQRFTEKFGSADLYGAILEVERAMELMDRHLQLNLLLIVLLKRLRKFLRR